MAKYLKPQTPLQHQSGDYIYPITTIDQVLMDNGERLNANIINIQLDGAPEDNINFGINADTLGGQKPEYYATAEDLVALNDSKLSTELLWENASPDSEFVPQTIPLDLSDYKFVLISCRRHIVTSYYVNTIAAVESSVMLSVAFTTDGGYRFEVDYRSADVSTSKITFFEASNVTASDAKAIDNKLMVPYRIYGIKGVFA